MRFEVVTEWQPNYLGKGKKKAGYTVYITGKETEIEKIDSVSNFIKEETGINFDGFADDTDYWNCFFLEIYEYDLISELKEAYKEWRKRK